MKNSILALFLSLLLIPSCGEIKKDINNIHANLNKKERKPTDPIGLKNETGHWCYMNAIIQSLYNLNMQRNCFNQPHLSPNEEILNSIFNEYWSMQLSTDQSQGLFELKKNLVKATLSEADWGHQNCPMEVLSNLSDATHSNEIIYQFKNNNLQNLIPSSIRPSPFSVNPNNDYFIIQLDRRQDWKKKNLDPLPIPLEIDRNLNKYKLNSVIFHIGTSSTSGHYTALVIKDDESFYCNDENIEDGAEILKSLISTGKTDEESKLPHILFYRKIQSEI